MEDLIEKGCILEIRDSRVPGEKGGRRLTGNRVWPTCTTARWLEKVVAQSVRSQEGRAYLCRIRPEQRGKTVLRKDHFRDQGSKKCIQGNKGH